MLPEARTGWTVPVHVIFFLSGAAGLGYEIVWTRMFAVGLGHEMPSMLAVVAAFFGGLAIGAWSLDGVVSRSAVPGRWYAGLEILIGLWGVVSIALVPILNRVAADLIGVDPSPLRHWAVSFAVPFLGLLPATAAMGATFPAMERLVGRLRGSGGTVAGLYAVNTAGAVVGTMLATFVIAPALGYRAAVLALVIVNVTCAVGTWLGPAAGERGRTPVAHAFSDPPGPWRIGITVFATGLLGIGYEVLCVRVMAQVLENTVYSFASALSVYLLGTAVGAALYHRFARKTAFTPALIWLLQLVTCACLLGTLVLGRSGVIYEAVRASLGGGALASVGAEMVLALLVFLPATVAMGATFSHLALAARGAKRGVGRALGLNTLGGALAPPLFGVLLMPMIGTKWTLLLIAAGYLPLLPVRGLSPARLVPTAVSLLFVLALPATLVLVEAPPGFRIVDYREGVMAAVAVTEDSDGERLLKVNNRFSMGGMVRSFADRRQAHLPLLLHPDPERVLFLGLGSGITAGAATEHPGVEITGVELLPEVVDLLGWFEPTNRLDRLDVERDYLVADARRFVRADADTYDVIIADLFHPARDGSGALYTREHFEAVRARLGEGGIFCQWLPLYQLDLDTLRLIVRTYLAVFPEVRAYIAHFNVVTPMLGLVGRMEAATYPSGWFDRRTGGRAPLRGALEELALSGDLTLFGCLLAGRADLEAFAGEGPLNTDDHPRVIFEAPKFVYRKREPEWGRLEAMLDACAPGARDVVADEDTTAGRALVGGVDRYLAARDLYLRGAMRLSGGRDAEGLDLMLESVRRGPEFRTSYVVCLQMAIDRQTSDPETARRILRSLKEAQPTDPRAGQYLRRLFRE